MNTTVTYVCAEPGCGDVFTDPEPSEAYGQYLDHIATVHDPIEQPHGDRYRFPDRLEPLDDDTYYSETPD